MFGNRKRGQGDRYAECRPPSNDCPSDAPCGGPAPLDATLSSVVCGCRCRIRRHHARGAVRQRLLDMGFIPNAEVEVVRVATLGDPMEVRVGDSWVTLRRTEAEKIEITDC